MLPIFLQVNLETQKRLWDRETKDLMHLDVLGKKRDLRLHVLFIALSKKKKSNRGKFHVLNFRLDFIEFFYL